MKPLSRLFSYEIGQFNFFVFSKVNWTVQYSPVTNKHRRSRCLTFIHTMKCQSLWITTSHWSSWNDHSNSTGSFNLCVFRNNTKWSLLDPNAFYQVNVCYLSAILEDPFLYICNIVSGVGSRKSEIQFICRDPIWSLTITWANLCAVAIGFRVCQQQDSKS